MPRLLQPAFTRGELSPLLRARVDTALYQSGLRRLRNMLVRPQGGVSNRPGTTFVSIAASDTAGASVLIPFIFSTTQAYILEFAAGTIRVFANGGFVASGSGTKVISSVSVGASPSFTRTITTTLAHGYTAGQIVHISGVIATGSYAVNGAWRVLTTPTATTFTVQAPQAIKGQYFSGGATALDIQVANPYSADELADLRFAQSADVLTVTHPSHPQYEFRRLSASSFEFVEVDFEDGPFLDLNTDYTAQMHVGAAFGTTTLTCTKSVFFESHVGALIKIESRNLANVKPWESGGLLANAAESTLGIQRRSEGKVYRCVTDFTPAAGKSCRSGSVRPVHDFGVQPDGSGKQISTDIEREGVEWEYLHGAFGVARITAYIGTASVTVQILKRMPDDVVGGVTTAQGPWTMTGDGVDTTLSIAGATDHNKYNYEVTINGTIQEPETFSVDAAGDVLTFFTAPGNGLNVSARQLSPNNRSDVWAFGAWSDHQGYPGLVCYYQDRIIYAASEQRPQTVWASKVGDYTDFGVSTPLVDDDALDFTMNARQINAIRDLIPLDKLIAMTAAGSWQITDGENEVLTPSTVGFKPQSYRGAKRIRSVLAGDEAIFVHDAGREIRTLGYRYENDKFAGVDLSIAAEHLLTKERTVVDMDYAEEPYSILHVVRSDGEMLALTYDPEQEVTAWSTHDTLDGTFERVCVIPEDGDSAVYAIVRREIGSRTFRSIERFADREIEEEIEGVFCDAAISFDGRNTTAVTLTVFDVVASTDVDVVASTINIFSPNTPPDLVVINFEREVDGETETYEFRATLVEYQDTFVLRMAPIGTPPSWIYSVATTDWGVGFDTFSGAHHLEGATVTALADGGVEPDQVVTGGQVELASPAVLVHAGLPVTAEMETLDINIVGQETVRSNAKHIGKVDVIVYRSRNIMVGPDEDRMDEIPTRELDDEYDAEALKEDVHEIYIASANSTNGRVFVRHDQPLPLTVLGIIPHVKIGTAG